MMAMLGTSRLRSCPNDGSLLFSDDGANVIYRVSYEK